MFYFPFSLINISFSLFPYVAFLFLVFCFLLLGNVCLLNSLVGQSCWPVMFPVANVTSSSNLIVFPSQFPRRFNFRAVGSEEEIVFSGHLCGGRSFPTVNTAISNQPNVCCFDITTSLPFRMWTSTHYRLFYTQIRYNVAPTYSMYFPMYLFQI